MVNTLRIKRRATGAAGPPDTLAAAELAFNELNNTLYYGKGNSAGTATSILSIAGPGAYLPLTGGALSGGLSFGSVTAATNNDLSRHIALYGAGFGFSVSSGRLNYNVGLTSTHSFVINGVDKATVGATGIIMPAGTDITLARDPTVSTQATTKNYVDTTLGAYLPFTGGTMLGPLTTANLVVNGTITGTGIGFDIGDIPGPIVSQGGIAALRPPAELIFQRNAFAATDGQDFRFRRITAFTGGNASNINKVITIEAVYGAGDTCTNWPFLIKAMNSSATTGTLTSAYVQAWRNAGAGQTTGLITDVADFQSTASSSSGTLTSQEWDLNATDVDDMANGSRFGGIGGRQMVHAVFANMSTTINSQYTAGIWFGTGINGTAKAYVDSLLCVQGSAPQPTLIRNFLDSRGAAPPPGVTDPVAAVRMSAGHIIDFNGGPALTSPPGNYFRYDSATSKLFYYVAGVAKMSIDASGNVRAAGTVTGSVAP